MSFEMRTNDIESSKLNPVEKEMYEKCISINPGLTEDDWLELRESAKSTNSPRVKEFFALNSLCLNEKPDADTLEELKS